MINTDVLILGGGVSGNLMAQRLKLSHHLPDISFNIVDKRSSVPDYFFNILEKNHDNSTNI